MKKRRRPKRRKKAASRRTTNKPEAEIRPRLLKAENARPTKMKLKTPKPKRNQRNNYFWDYLHSYETHQQPPTVYLYEFDNHLVCQKLA